MMKYKTKPVEIEAIQWTGKNLNEMEEAFGLVAGFDTLEVGSYVVKNAKGRLEVFSQNAFHETHERVLVWEDNI
jgi:hypothetical protein